VFHPSRVDPYVDADADASRREAQGVMHDALIFGAVIGLRLSVPLLILRFPLPGVIAAIVADGDRAILHAYTDLSLDNYQLYDKSLDLFYLSIAYVATLRNWRDPTAIALGRFLWFYRLIGVALFALIGDHPLLFLFPAAFEFYFIIYETIRVRWDTARLTRSDLAMIAVVAWLLKLPQEYWLHVARRGTTAWMERTVYHATLSPAYLLLLPGFLLAWVVMTSVVRRVLRVLPAADHRWRFDAGPHDPVARRNSLDERLPGGGLRNPVLMEKLALVTLVGMVFAEFVPSIDANALQISLGFGFLVVANAAVTAWFDDEAASPRSAAADVAVMCAINVPIAFALLGVASWLDASVATTSALGLAVLAGLLIGLHDRYRPLRH
jgi:hypothetical protein